jgi:hypothetical protein
MPVSMSAPNSSNREDRGEAPPCATVAFRPLFVDDFRAFDE